MEPLDRDDPETLDALERLIRRADGFALAFARVNSLARRRELTHELCQRLEGDIRVLEVDIPPETTDLEAVLADVYADLEGEGKAAFFVTGLEGVLSSVRERTGFLPVLNYKRENLQRSVPAPVVLWLPEFALRYIARGAPDLWAWRSGMFEFAPDPDEVDRTWNELQNSGSVDEYARMMPIERRSRIGTLESLYHDYADRDNPNKFDQAVVRADLADRLGRLYMGVGDLNTAVEWVQRSLAESRRVLGPEHPRTLSSLNNLASLLQATGEYAGAEPYFRRSLEVRERLLGPNHLQTLTAASNLGGLLKEMGDYSGADSHFRRVLEVRERSLGPEHPQTLTSINNLAGLLESKGDYVGADTLYRRALEARTRVLGPEHPDTLSSINNLASLLELKGDYVGADTLYRRTLEARTRVLGPEHPDTLSSVNNLASLLQSIGDYVGADTLYRRTLEARTRVLGPKHPDTLSSVNNLASLLQAMRDFIGAESLFQRALAGCEQTLGTDHPHTGVVRSNLAALLSEKHSS